MKKLLVWMLLIAGFSSNFYTAVADSDEYAAEYSRLKKLKSCIETLKAADSRFKTMLSHWFTDDSELDVAKNFEFVRQKHTAYFQTIKEFAAAALPDGNDIEQIAKAIALLDREHKGILSELRHIQESDGLFSLSLPPISDGLGEVMAEFEAAKTVCEEDSYVEIDQVGAQITALRFQLLTMTSYIHQAAVKRSLLFRSVLENKKVRLLRSYSAATHEPLEGLLNKVNDTLAADNLYRRIHEWWNTAAVVSGLGRGSVTKYLQYTEALRILKSDFQLGRNFQNELAMLSKIAPEVRSEIEGDLDLYVKQLKDQIDKLETGGYRPVYERQKYLTSRRRELIARYGEDCRRALDAFAQIASLVKSVESFRTAEEVYKLQVNACSGSQLP